MTVSFHTGGNVKGYIEHSQHGSTSFVNKPAVSVYQATVIASGLDLYRKTGMKPNRAYTPKAMMATAAAITGKKFKARDYEGAAKALREWAQGQVASGKVEVRHAS